VPRTRADNKRKGKKPRNMVTGRNTGKRATNVETFRCGKEKEKAGFGLLTEQLYKQKEMIQKKRTGHRRESGKRKTKNLSGRHGNNCEGERKRKTKA